MEHKILIIKGVEAQKTIAAILFENGYTVKLTTALVGNKKVKAIEYWEEEK